MQNSLDFMEFADFETKMMVSLVLCHFSHLAVVKRGGKGKESRQSQAKLRKS